MLTFGSDPLPSVKYAAGADTLYFSQFGWSVFSRLKLQPRFLNPMAVKSRRHFHERPPSLVHRIKYEPQLSIISHSQ